MQILLRRILTSFHDALQSEKQIYSLLNSVFHHVSTSTHNFSTLFHELRASNYLCGWLRVVVFPIGTSHQGAALPFFVLATAVPFLRFILPCLLYQTSSVSASIRLLFCSFLPLGSALTIDVLCPFLRFFPFLFFFSFFCTAALFHAGLFLVSYPILSHSQGYFRGFCFSWTRSIWHANNSSKQAVRLLTPFSGCRAFFSDYPARENV